MMFGARLPVRTSKNIWNIRLPRIITFPWIMDPFRGERINNCPMLFFEEIRSVLFFKLQFSRFSHNRRVAKGEDFKLSTYTRWEKKSAKNRPPICPNYFLKYAWNVTNISSNIKAVVFFLGYCFKFLIFFG